MCKSIKLLPVAIGSLPHENPDDAMELVLSNFSQNPFPPQLGNFNKNEDMILQFLEGFPAININNGEVDNESDEFWDQLESFYTDYEGIINDINSPLLEKYAISRNYSSSFPYFLNIVKKYSPFYAKSQITGAFTFSTSIHTSDNKAVVFDENLRDVVVKFLTLKAIWQIKQIKNVNKNAKPIIFMDEPSISQVGTSAYLTISNDDVISMIREISENIKQCGALSAIHCCGKCDWQVPIASGVNIINFDAYSFFDNFVIYHKSIKKHIENGGLIAWGMVPTFDEDLLKGLTADKLAERFISYVNKLTKYGINEKLVIDNSLITSSCGAGALSVIGAKKAMDLVKNLSDKLKERYK